ncbi:hypothetical protein WJX77_003448 [Trebouxia sp. C0004]
MLHVSISDHNDKTSNSLTGASASSSGAIHYASALPPSNPMPLARPRAHGSMKDEGHIQAQGPQEISQEAHVSPQAQGRDHHGQEDSILQAVIPQMIRRVDCEIWYSCMYNLVRYEANVQVNGKKVQDLFDFSLQELKERLRLKIKRLDASSSSLLTEAVLWTSKPCAWDPKAEAFQI